MSDESMIEDGGADVQDFFPGDDDSAGGGEELNDAQQEMVDNLTGEDSETSSEDADDQTETDTDEETSEDAEGDGEEDDSSAAEESGISREVMFAAAQAGLGFEDIEALGSDAAIQTAIRIAEKGQTKDSDDTAQESATKEDFDWQDPEFGEDYDEGLVNALTGMNTQAKAAFSSMQERNQILQSQIAESNLRVEVMQFDLLVNGLGEEWKDVLGEGSMYDVGKDQLEARQKVFNAVATNGKPLSKSSMKEALGMAHPNVIKQAGQKAIQNKISSRKKIQKPESAKTAKKGALTEDDMTRNLESRMSAMA